VKTKISIMIDKVGTKANAGALGFSMIELLAVVVLIVLVAGAAGGMYLGSYKRQVVEKSARQFLLAAKYARTLAVDLGKSCKLNLDTEKNRFFLTVESFDKRSGQRSETIIKNEYFKPTELAEGVRFENIVIRPGSATQQIRQINNKVITFGPNGRAEATMLQITDGKNHYTVIISAATGRTSIERGIVEG